MLEVGCGATNLVARATATAAELDDEELRAGRRRLERKVRRYGPRVVAIVGLGAYRVAFDRPRATLGLQPDTIAGAAVWVLPNTSGLNANHQSADFAKAFGELRTFVRAEGKGQRAKERNKGKGLEVRRVRRLRLLPSTCLFPLTSPLPFALALCPYFALGESSAFRSPSAYWMPARMCSSIAGLL